MTFDGILALVAHQAKGLPPVSSPLNTARAAALWGNPKGGQEWNPGFAARESIKCSREWRTSAETTASTRLRVTSGGLGRGDRPNAPGENGSQPA